jgi:hypothetical protein
MGPTKPDTKNRAENRVQISRTGGPTSVLFDTLIKVPVLNRLATRKLWGGTLGAVSTSDR